MTLFTLLFVALRLMGYIDWSWFFVLLPSIVDVVLVLLAFLLQIAGLLVFNKEMKQAGKSEFYQPKRIIGRRLQ